jgi:hypothetical protein
MTVLQELNHRFLIAASAPASTEADIARLLAVSTIKVPEDYLDIVRERSDVEIAIAANAFVRIWGAARAIDLNGAHFIQQYIPNSLAIGDDEGGQALILATGLNGYGLYLVGFGDLDMSDASFIARTLKDFLVFGEGVFRFVCNPHER